MSDQSAAAETINTKLADDGFGDEDTMKDKYLTFRIGEEEFAIEIACVIEIVGIQKITQVPDMPNFVKGVINLRGQVIPVVDVRLRFKMPERDYDERTCVIVVRMKDVLIGLVVDRVNEVRDIPEDAVSPPSKIIAGEANRYVKGMGKLGDEVKILLDVEKLLFDDELAQLG